MSTEFEDVVNDILFMFEQRNQDYGTSEEALQNFYDIADITDTTPLRAGEVLMAKHGAAIKQWLKRPGERGYPNQTKAMDEGYWDRAVYAIIQLVQYRRLTCPPQVSESSSMQDIESPTTSPNAGTRTVTGTSSNSPAKAPSAKK